MRRASMLAATAALLPGLAGAVADAARPFQMPLLPSRENRHILRTWTKDGTEYAFHATKGLRRRRVAR